MDRAAGALGWAVPVRCVHRGRRDVRAGSQPYPDLRVAMFGHGCRVRGDDPGTACIPGVAGQGGPGAMGGGRRRDRSEEHTSELQSLMRISYAVFCLKKKNKKKQ